MKIFTTILFLSVYCSIYSQTLIPDVNFEQELIDLGLDTGSPNGVVPTANIDTVIELNIISGNLAALNGIEDFSALEELRCSCISLHTVDLSQNDNLRSIDLANGGAVQSSLTYVYLPDSTEYLDLSGNTVLANLDLTTLTKLSTLKLKRDGLNSLNVSQNLELKHLDLLNNSLSAIDLTPNADLEFLNVSNNNLTSLNLTQNPQLNFLSFSMNNLTTIDLSANTLLEKLYCFQNSLSTLDVTNNPELDVLYCSYNDLPQLDLTQNDSISLLECTSNLLTNISFGNMSELSDFRANSNDLSAMDISQCVDIFRFQCASNQLTSLVLPPTSDLKYFDCAGNFLTELDLSILADDWEEVDCSNNNLNCLTVAPSSSPQEFSAMMNPNLTCIETSDDAWVNWFSTVQIIDSQSFFSQSCNGNCMTSIEEQAGSSKKLIRIVDMLGRDVQGDEVNTPLIYVYDDGSIERRFVVEL